MTFNEIDRKSLKELRTLLYEKKKVRDRIRRDYQPLQEGENYRVSRGDQKSRPVSGELER